MAVDYFHRVVVTGPHATVDLFRRQLRRTVTRSVAKLKWRESIPFSFERLYKLVPAAIQIEPELPNEPFDSSVWPIRCLPGDLAELRYKLHTRNRELSPFVGVLSKKFPALMFRVVTHCVDDGEIASYRICNGRVRTWILPEARQNAYWDRARREFALNGTDVYEDDGARYFAEEAMREEALDHWEPEATGPQGLRKRVRNWCNRPVSRDLESERTILMAEIAEVRSR